ncbi:MAG: diguanylate cyclase [Magnetococcales bacterium]|nr:diguanylate cyclase [Magnetococcales bacterium]MBF0150692.1 diguanylate cyclase [Magnetococcales bacterium]MBF0348241.1 diguanylate cyclase [Magnetococcales bacterium]MBF0631686.1 diguanylate cyclase [Magnetococcales bacterium]
MEGEKAKLLIVDDEKINLDILIGLLGDEYRTVVAKDGEQALHRLEALPLPDLVLLDVIMPGMDGFEVCRRMKENLLTRNIPVIFVTSRTGEMDEAVGFDAGAVDYIVKPYHPAIVRARVRTHVDLKRRGDMLERLSNLDPLTGIANRRRLDEFLNFEWSRSIRTGHPLSMILIDVDHFKRFNDTYGHGQGDRCLIQVARALSRPIQRAMDLVARYGGEEFACILPETGAEGAMAVAERMRVAVSDLGIPHVASTVAPRVTISLGVASVTPNKNDLAQFLMEKADDALYLAKNRGRNQVVFSEAPGQPQLP